MTRQDTAGLGGDVTINGTRYPLAIDKRTQLLVWNEGDAVNLQDGDPGVPVSVEWPNGVPGGIGETKRISRDSDGCAFATVDTSNYGFWRLPPRRVTVTPGTAPTDNPTFGFEDYEGGDFLSESGTFAGATTTGNQTVTHTLGVAPKAILLWSAGGTGSTAETDASLSIGFTDLTTSYSVSIATKDGVSPTQTGSAMQAVLWAKVSTAATPAISDSVTYVSSSASNFVINWGTNAGVAYQMHYLLLGGTDVSAKALTWTTGATAGAETAVTGVGFTPSVVIHAAINSASAAPTGAINTANLSTGVMCADGTQWTQFLHSKDNVATSVSNRFQLTTGCLGHAVANPSTDSHIGYQSFLSMGNDGFTTRRDTGLGGLASVIVVSLCLKGVRATASTFNKSTQLVGASNFTQDVGTDIPSTILLASAQAATSSLLSTHLAYSLGAATWTGAVGTSSAADGAAIYDQHNVGTSNSYKIDDSAIPYQKLTNTDGSTVDAKLSTNTPITINTGFRITWQTNDAVASEICYLALRPLRKKLTSPANAIYILQGQYGYKLTVASNVITVQATKDFGTNATAGHPTKYGTPTYESRWFVPVGDSIPFYRLEQIGTTTTDIWSQDAVEHARAFATTNQGVNTVLVRAFDNHLLDISVDGTTWQGDDFEVGTPDTAITSLEDSGTTLFVAKEDNLLEFDSGGITRQLTRYPKGDKASTYGAGLMVPTGSSAAFYNHKSLHLYRNSEAVMVGPDAIRTNKSIPNITFEPYRGTHYETVYASDGWVYTAYRVTESSVNKTYVFAGQKTRTGYIWHGFERFDGIAHLALVDSSKRLWFTYDPESGSSVIGYWQIGPDGSPDAGRDAIGYGAASTTYSVVYPRENFGSPHTLKRLRMLEVIAWNPGTTLPIQLYAYRDGRDAEAVDSSIVKGIGNNEDYPISRRSFAGTDSTATVTTAFFGSSSVSIVYTGSDVFAVGDTIRVDDERFLIASINTGTNTLSCLGGRHGTRNSSHAAGATIYFVHDLCNEVQIEASITTSAGYSNTVTDGSELRFVSLRLHAFVCPDGARKVHFQVDTARPFSNEAIEPDDPMTMNDTLRTHERGAPMAYIDPDGNTGTMYISNVKSKAYKEKGETHYIIDVDAIKWLTTTTLTVI